MKLAQWAKPSRGVRLSAGVTLADAEEGKILFDSRRGKYWHLNDVGLEVVEGLTAGRTLDEVASTISHRTGADEEAVRTDCEHLVQELYSSRLLKGTA